jgi:quercetin dioxygenase-like cupin family protein
MAIDEIVRKPEIHPKGWGREIWIANTLLYCGKILVLNEGKRCSIHYHKLKDETFYILKGKVEMRIWQLNEYPDNGGRFVMNPSEVLHVPPTLVHQFLGLEDSEILEVSTQHFEEDSYRLKRGD